MTATPCTHKTNMFSILDIARTFASCIFAAIASRQPVTMMSSVIDHVSLADIRLMGKE